MQPTLTLRLREETKGQHTAAEHSPVEQALVKGDVSRTLFVAWLAQRLDIHRALETAIDALRAADARVAEIITPALYQTANIESDLAGFKATPDEVSVLPATREFRATLAAWAAREPVAPLGAFYVLEGSKNGARFIAKALRRSVLADRPDGSRYLDPHGADQPALWARVKAGLDGLALTPHQAEAILDAAKGTFDCIARVDQALETHLAGMGQPATAR